MSDSTLVEKVYSLIGLIIGSSTVMAPHDLSNCRRARLPTLVPSWRQNTLTHHDPR